MSEKRKRQTRIEHYLPEKTSIDHDDMIISHNGQMLRVNLKQGTMSLVRRRIVKNGDELLHIEEVAITEAVAEASPVRRSFLVDLLLPAGEAEEAHEAVQDMVPKWIEAHGPLRAELLRRKTLTWIVFGQHLNRTLRLLERIRNLIWSPPSSGG